MHGWTGKVLRVDLSRGEIREEALDAKVAKDYIGGRGLGIHCLLQELICDGETSIPLDELSLCRFN